jgi:hypothetical protein
VSQPPVGVVQVWNASIHFMKNSRLSKLRFIAPTGEYNGGVLGGFGFGMFVMAAILLPEHRVTVPWIYLSAGACIITGSIIARAGQRKKLEKDELDEKHET